MNKNTLAIGRKLELGFVSNMKVVGGKQVHPSIFVCEGPCQRCDGSGGPCQYCDGKGGECQTSRPIIKNNTPHKRNEQTPKAIFN